MQKAAPNHHTARLGLFMIVVTAMLWGTVGIAGKGVAQVADTNALSIAFFRLAFAAPVLLLLLWKQHGTSFFAQPRADQGLMLLLGVLMAMYQICYFAAVVRVGVTVSVLVALCSAPVLVALLSALLLGERLTPRVGVALFCAIAGTVLLVGVPTESSGAVQHNLLSGVLLALGAGLSYAGVTLCSRSLAGHYHPLQPVTVGFVVGALVILPFALLAGGLVLAYPPAGWALLVYMGLFPTALAYMLFVGGLRSTTATAASIVTLLEPLTGAVLAWLVFQEQLGPWGLLGALLLLGAMGVLVWQPSRQPAAA
jgi:DME family drug/metabolite transporter